MKIVLKIYQNPIKYFIRWIKRKSIEEMLRNNIKTVDSRVPRNNQNELNEEEKPEKDIHFKNKDNYIHCGEIHLSKIIGIFSVEDYKTNYVENSSKLGFNY